MSEMSHQQAWIHGLPCFDQPGGVPVEVVDFSAPEPGEHELSLTVFPSRSMIPTLHWQSTARTKIPKFSLVLRRDPRNQRDDEFQFANARIVSVRASKESKGAESILISFASMSLKTALPANPGPPPDAPEVHHGGRGRGWIFGMSENPEEGVPFGILDFAPPHFNGRLVVYFDELPLEIRREAQIRSTHPELSLVLPDQARRQYIEYKLWDTRSFRVVGGQYLLLESDWIVCLTGQ